MVSREFLRELDAAYLPLEQKRSALLRALSGRPCTLQCGWYNGHYSRAEDGGYRMDHYPIPVIEVRGCCDIEIGFGSIGISTKLSRADALERDFAKFSGVPFEVHGVDDFLADFLLPGMTLGQMRENIRASGEEDIGFSFTLPFETPEERVAAFIDLLIAEGFYY